MQERARSRGADQYSAKGSATALPARPLPSLLLPMTRCAGGGSSPFLSSTPRHPAPASPSSPAADFTPPSSRKHPLPVAFPAPAAQVSPLQPPPPAIAHRPCWLLWARRGQPSRFGDPGASIIRPMPASACQRGRLSSHARVQNAAPAWARVGGEAPTLPAGGKACRTGGPP